MSVYISVSNLSYTKILSGVSIKSRIFKWNYIDIQGEETSGQIIGSIYEPNIIRKAHHLNKKCYDYILQSACASIDAQSEKYQHISILLSSSFY